MTEPEFRLCLAPDAKVGRAAAKDVQVASANEPGQRSAKR